MGRETPVALRVLLYTAAPRSAAGGVQNALTLLERGLRRRGHAVRTAWSEPGDDDAPALPLRLRDPRGFAAFAAELRRFRPDVVNIHFVTGQSAYVLLAARMFRFKTVLSAHGSDILRPRRSVARLLPLMLSGADAITAVSEDLRHAIRRLSPQAGARVRIIPNGIDVEFWSKAERRAPAPPRIVAVGRLERVKGFDLLLEAFARVRAREPQARLDLIGEGAEAAALRAQAARLRVSDAVSFLGRLDREGVRDRLSEAAAFALPSRSEGMPLTLLEAMAAGAPIAAAAVGAIPETLQGGAGLLVRPQDAAALGEALISLLAAPKAAAAMAARARARARALGADAACEAFEQVYGELVSPLRGRPRAA